MDENGRGRQEVRYAYEEPKEGGRTYQKNLVTYQRSLIDAGLLPEKDAKGNPNADGYFGDLTRDAVKSFQKQQGLKATGNLDEKTIELLMGVIGS